jgi:cell division protein FtsB
MEYKIEHSEDNEVIAQIARDDLGLLLPGEQVFS